MMTRSEAFELDVQNLAHAIQRRAESERSLENARAEIEFHSDRVVRLDARIAELKVQLGIVEVA